MKSRVLMAALVVVMLMGVRTYAHDCGPCSEVDPCGACNGCAKSCDLFSGLKKLVACSPCAASECGPCDAIVACTPCGETSCDPCGSCGDVGCNDGCGPKFVFGSRLKAFFAAKGCDPCDPCGTGCDDGCNPCDTACGPCDVACDDGCGPCEPKFAFRKLFKGFGKMHCSCNDGCGPCDTACGACDGCGTACDPCGACDSSCGPCDNSCGACDSSCGPCDAGCGEKFGCLLDKPRRNIKKFFDGFRLAKCNPCNPCDPCGPCDTACGSPCDTVCGSPCSSLNANCHGEAAAPVSQLPEASK